MSLAWDLVTLFGDFGSIVLVALLLWLGFTGRIDWRKERVKPARITVADYCKHGIVVNIEEVDREPAD